MNFYPFLRSQKSATAPTSEPSVTLLDIFLYRNSAAIDRDIDENQSGFRRRKGIYEGIFDLGTISEKYLK